MKLLPIRLYKDADPILIELLRTIYVRTINDLATKPLVPPTPTEQQEWWAGLDHSKVKVFLWRIPDRPWEVVAFSMVTDRGGYSTPMFAIDPAFQGRGYAHTIIPHYIRTAGMPLRGEQLISNQAIRNLNEIYGWTVFGSDGRVEFLRHDGPTPVNGYPDYQAILDGLDG